MAGVITASVVAAASIGFSVYQQTQARQEQKKANKKAERIEALEAQRARVKAVRQNRIEAAQVTATAGAQGVGGSSGVEGTVASLGTQSAANLSFTNQVDALNTARQGNLNNAASDIALAGYAQQLGSLATTAVGSGYLGMPKKAPTS